MGAIIRNSWWVDLKDRIRSLLPTGGCLVCSRVRASLSLLDSPSLCVPRSHSRGEQGKIEALHFVSIDSSKLSTHTYAVRPCARTVPAQVESESGSKRSHITRRLYVSQIHCICWWRQRACKRAVPSWLSWAKKAEGMKFSCLGSQNEMPQ